MDLTIDAVRSGSSVRLWLRGEIDVATTGLVHDAVIAALMSRSVERVVLDLADLTFIDSSGMGTLVACHKAVEVRGGSFRLENLAPFVRRQLFAAGLLGLLGGVEAETEPTPTALA